MKSSIKKYLADRSGIDRATSIKIIERFCSNNIDNTINLIMLWGASSKPRATKSDKDALLYLLHFLNELEYNFKKDCKLSILFTDTHVYLNGYDLNLMESYYLDIKYHLEKHKFTYKYSSDILKNYIYSNGYDGWKAFIDNILNNPIELFKTTEITEEQAYVFKKYAKKHCNRLANKKSINSKTFNEDQASKAYLYLSSIEKKIIEQNFTDSMFITYMNKEEDFILPNLPIVRLYTIKSGLRTRPWFSN